MTKIVDQKGYDGIHVWNDGSIHLDSKKWHIIDDSGICGNVHIYKKEVNE